MKNKRVTSVTFKCVLCMYFLNSILAFTLFVLTLCPEEIPQNGTVLKIICFFVVIILKNNNTRRDF